MFSGSPHEAMPTTVSTQWPQSLLILMMCAFEQIVIFYFSKRFEASLRGFKLLFSSESKKCFVLWLDLEGPVKQYCYFTFRLCLSQTHALTLTLTLTHAHTLTLSLANNRSCSGNVWRPKNEGSVLGYVENGFLRIECLRSLPLAHSRTLSPLKYKHSCTSTHTYTCGHARTHTFTLHNPQLTRTHSNIKPLTFTSSHFCNRPVSERSRRSNYAQSKFKTAEVLSRCLSGKKLPETLPQRQIFK